VSLHRPALLFFVVLAVCACASREPPPAAVPAAAEPRTALAAGLAIERQWLDSWFRGTPVRIEQRPDGTLIVEVPQEFCFDAGRSGVRPPLAAVLDKVAESLRRQPLARVILLAAPDDKAASGVLARERATQVHRRLLDRGIAASRLAEPAATRAAAVQLRIGAAVH
jgi:outer membrane protein OmpA-like peptidoglycan-associated protein